MTNINCAKNCKFQTEGKCCYDSIFMTINHEKRPLDPDCPYQIPKDEEKISETTCDSFRLR